jgi:Branched-chain amino acid transport system / permease component
VSDGGSQVALVQQQDRRAAVHPRDRQGDVVTAKQPSSFCRPGGQPLPPGAPGAALALTSGQPINGVSNFYQAPNPVQSGRRAGAVIIFVVVAVLAWILLERTYVGRQIYAVGGNREATRLAGIPVARRLMLTYICGGCAGLVPVLVIGRIGVGDPNVGTVGTRPRGHPLGS